MIAPTPAGAFTPLQADALPAELLDLVVELAVAIHKRAFYPELHPLLRGAVEQLHARMSVALASAPDLAIGVANRRLVVSGFTTGEDHIHLRELAGRLHEHLLGAVTFQRGLTPNELSAFLAAISTTRGTEPLGTRDPATIGPWPHIQLSPVAFDRLALAGDHDAAVPGESRAGELWISLARAALAGGGWSDDEANDPGFIATTFDGHKSDRAYDQVVVSCLVQLLGELRAAGTDAPVSVRRRTSELIESLSDAGLSRLVSLAQGAERGNLLVGALDSLSANAVVGLARAAAQSGAQGTASRSLLRLLSKLARQASGGGATPGREADAMLRLSIRRLLEGWTLGNPNHEQYDALLSAGVRTITAPGTTRRDALRDLVEPDRLLEIGLHTGSLTQAVRAAFSRLSLQSGVTAALDLVRAAPASPERDALLDQLLNDGALREQLVQVRPDWVLVEHAVHWLRGGAARSLLLALDARPADGEQLATLIEKTGGDGIAAAGQAFATLSSQAQKQLILLFERVDTWPPEVDPLVLTRHSDAGVRREAIRHLVRNESSHEQVLPLAARDPDHRVLNLCLQVALRNCSGETCRALIRRYDDDASLGAELRTRIIRAVGRSRSRDALTWLMNIAAPPTWLFGSRKLRSSAESLAALAALSANYESAVEAAELIAAGRGSRSGEIRRAATARRREESSDDD
ncbi:MAG: hypothetical protein ACT4OZ_13445 [Gemmatimonadota bacterium]